MNYAEVKAKRLRVQIPAYMDMWMRGDRFGTVMKITKPSPSKAWPKRSEVAHVLLDISGKTVRVVLDDCEVLDVQHVTVDDIFSNPGGWMK